MNITELKSELAALEAEMSEKAIKGPQARITIGSSRTSIYIDASDEALHFDGNEYKIFYADSVSGCIAAAHDYIAAIPSPEEAVTREYLTRVASAVDYATEHSIAEESVAPLRGVSCAMTDNLLTKETTQ